MREGNGRRFQGRRKGKEKSFSFVVIQSELSLVIHVFMSLVHSLNIKHNFGNKQNVMDTCAKCKGKCLCVVSAVPWKVEMFSEFAVPKTLNQLEQHTWHHFLKTSSTAAGN